MPHTPLVSAIITTYNRRKLVCEAIDSVLMQDYEPIEIIVVDDGSTDGTQARLREGYGDFIDLVRLDGPSGPGRPRNAGVDRASGEFLAFLDSDDQWVVRKTTRQVEVMQEAGNDVALVGGACAFVNGRGEEVLTRDYPPDEAGYEEFCVKVRLPGSGSNNLIRRSAFQEVGGFDESLVRAEDKDLWIRLLRRHEVRYVEDVTALIRIHDGERVGVNREVTKQCRKRVTEKIPEPHLRRRARAWDMFCNFRMHWPDEPARSLAYLGASFALHPTSIGDGIHRLKGAYWHLTG